MSTVHHYRSNLRDVFFNLFEFLDVGTRSLGQPPFEGMDAGSAREALTALEKLASRELAESFADADRHPPVLSPDGTVLLPESLKRSMEAYFAGGWHLLEAPSSLGGIGAPPTVVWAAFELTAGSNPAATFALIGTFMARMIDRLGTAAQRERYLPAMIDRRWASAMVLTEPDAGSDVGAASTRARHVQDDVWELEGVKRFITNGDLDNAENVVHLALARPEGAPAGTKGLSLFIVPKYWVETDGTLGARNGVRVTRLEKKLGLRASPTCEITYGGDVPARGLLMGGVHDGIRQMFHVIEQARMAVGVKSMSTLSTAYLNAVAYARDRVQGAELTLAHIRTAPRVPILQHADVRRMLLTQKAHAEGMRALVYFTADLQDQVERAGGHGTSGALAVDRLNELMLPLVKGYNSERAHDMLTLALQCYGGSGYVEDFPIEQYLRDQKVDSLYEGTTHIQALDLFFRKVGRDGGATLGDLFERIRVTLTQCEGGDALAEERRQLTDALTDVQATFVALAGKAQDSLHHVGLQANRVLFALTELVVGWLLVRHAAMALARMAGASDSDKAFYAGKVASARWFCREVLPTATVTRRMVEDSRLDVMELADEAWG